MTRSRRYPDPGDWVAIRARVFGVPASMRWGYLMPGGSPASAGCRVLTHAGFASCILTELAVLDAAPDLAEFPMRWSLPYAIGRTEDGAEVLADRDYRPRWERRGGSVRPVSDPSTVRGGGWEKIYFEDDAPWVDESALARCRALLAEWGVRPRPWTGLDGVSGVERI